MSLAKTAWLGRNLRAVAALFAAAALLHAGTAHGQPDASGKAPEKATGLCAAIPVVAAAYMEGDSPALIAPGHVLVIKVKDFSTWVTCRQVEKFALPVLYINHVPRPDLAVGLDGKHEALRFSLVLNEHNRAAWAASGGATETGSVGLGDAKSENIELVEAETSVDGTAAAMRLPFQVALADRSARLKGWIFVAVIAIAGVLVSWLTRLVRDRGSLAPGATEWTRSYSLARMQLWLWTLTIAATTGYLWITTGMLPSLGVETMALLGISAGTSGTAKLMEVKRHLGIPPVGPTRGFFLLDLIDDGKGSSVHRLQAVMANVGLAWIFFANSIQQLDFYTIPASWDGALFLSSGVYLGLKAGESA